MTPNMTIEREHLRPPARSLDVASAVRSSP